MGSASKRESRTIIFQVHFPSIPLSGHESREIKSALSCLHLPSLGPLRLPAFLQAGDESTF